MGSTPKILGTPANFCYIVFIYSSTLEGSVIHSLYMAGFKFMGYLAQMNPNIFFEATTQNQLKFVSPNFSD